jgi:hypothetical protein
MENENAGLGGELNELEGMDESFNGSNSNPMRRDSYFDKRELRRISYLNGYGLD